MHSAAHAAHGMAGAGIENIRECGAPTAQCEDPAKPADDNRAKPSRAEVSQAEPDQATHKQVNQAAAHHAASGSQADHCHWEMQSPGCHVLCILALTCETHLGALPRHIDSVSRAHYGAMASIAVVPCWFSRAGA